MRSADSDVGGWDSQPWLADLCESSWSAGGVKVVLYSLSFFLALFPGIDPMTHWAALPLLLQESSR